MDLEHELYAIHRELEIIAERLDITPPPEMASIMQDVNRAKNRILLLLQAIRRGEVQ